MLVRIDVTENEIRDGVRENCLCCPAARAINRVLNPVRYHVVVTEDRISIRGNSSGSILFQCETPEVVDEFICEFDGDIEVEPFSFPLDIPQEFLAISEIA